jgi:predicted Zn-dependent protease
LLTWSVIGTQHDCDTDKSAHTVTASSMPIGSDVRDGSTRMLSLLLLLLILGIQAIKGQTPKDAPLPNMESSRSLAPAGDENAARISEAMEYYKKGDLAHAKEQFEALHASRPKDVSLAVLLGYVYVKLGRGFEAIDLLRPLEPGNRKNAELEYILAFSLIQVGKDEEGVPRMEAIARVTHSANAYFIAGATQLQRGKMRPALINLKAAYRMDPLIPGLSTMVGQAEYALGDLSAAVLSFRSALRANPDDFMANLDLGAVRLKQRDFSTARTLLDLALRLQPKSPLARLEMAKLNISTGNASESVAPLEDLARSEPNWFEAHWQLAMAYFELGRSEDGKRERLIAQQLEAREQNYGTGSK